MLLFLTGIVLLVVGYLTYGRFVESVLGPDDRTTPAIKQADGVDYVVLPHWKNMLIQLLNIAGVGPVIGVIAGIKFGAIVFLLIPIGNIIGGATHDFIAGMASLRNRGANLPYFIKLTLGNVYYCAFSVFTVFLLALVVAVFINVPANLIDKTFLPNIPFFWGAVGSIFLYYIVATMFPVDKIIGKLYPIFGAVLLIGSGALLVSLLFRGFGDPAILTESEAFKAGKLTQPIIPCLFVTIACGILSGFHATQSPIIARTMKTERQARSSFYGMMVLEGVVAMIWAGAALAIYNLDSALMEQDATIVLAKITENFLGSWLGKTTVVAVVVLAITSGDTAMRSMRLTLAEMMKIDQKPIAKRLAICAPIIAAICGLLWWSNQNAASFGKLWNYFAWGNQVLAASTLAAGATWLYGLKKKGWIAALPGAFMTFVVVSYILWTSTAHGGPVGVGLELPQAYALAAVVTVVFIGWSVWRGLRFAKGGIVELEAPKYDFSEVEKLEDVASQEAVGKK
ncbi:MAG: carbon starvation protein A [Thermoguttaceae bacterium]|nr:carbon starvation protein A [Thermoguttaceae bacterium]